MTTPPSLSFVKGLFVLLVLLVINSVPEKARQKEKSARNG